MTRSLLSLMALAALAVAGCGRDEAATGLAAITPEALEASIRFLSSDLLEGRRPGSRGSELGALYISTQFELAGLQPAVGDSSYLQPVALAAMRPRTRLAFRARGGAALEPGYGSEFVARSGEPEEAVREEGELIFVGYGISATEHDWDDYKGVDVSGRFLLILPNDPGQALPGRFRGDTLTYYGLESYKLEEAARRGACGAILIHTRELAGYGWNVLESRRSGEEIWLEQAGGTPPVGVQVWLSQETAEQVVAMAGLDFATLLESARSERFRPISTGVTVSASVSGDVRRFSGVNVAGLLRGSDLQRAAEVVVFTAHYDHLGIGPAVDSDSIYNGAYDNASGTGLLLVLAEAFARLEPRPARSILFLAVTAAEPGFLGSRTYVEDPAVPLERTVANINLDGVNLWGPTEDVAVIGSETSSLESIAAVAAEAEDLRLRGDPSPELGYLYRSDQLSFLEVGIPVAYVGHGLDYVGRMPGWGRRKLAEYRERDYQQPSDELKADADLRGGVQQGRFAFRLGLSVANAADKPTWRQWPAAVLPSRGRD
jgi:Zn-dependent M28 family amino/carboxypeptidase